MKMVPLSNGMFAKVDDADFDRVSAMRWHYTRGYAVANQRIEKYRWRMIRMHRFILGFPEGMEVDHRDHDGLNNCRSNLRACSRTQNNANRSRRAGAFRGVYQDKKGWSAKITVRGQCRFIGWFTDPKLAAQAYDRHAIEAFGDFATLNFPQEAMAACSPG